MEKPLVSVIIPVYNTEKYLSDAIESVLSQSYTHIEVILVNDGSTDSSEDVIIKYQKLDSRILYKSIPNSGSSAARLIGLSMANGEYVQFLDSDDLLIPDAIELLVARAIETGADMVIPKFWFQWLNGSRTESLGTSSPIMEGRAYLRDVFKGQGYWCVWVFTRRSLYSNLKERAVDISFGEDAIWKTQLLLAVNKVAGLDKPLIIYNERELSLSHHTSHNAYRFREFKRYVKWLTDCIERNGLKEYMQEALAFFHVNNVCQQMSWHYLDGIEAELRKVCADKRKYPYLLSHLRRRQRKVFKWFEFSEKLGMWLLLHYISKGKL